MATIKKLSIIIPAYNVADYIEKCIRSLQEQDILESDYEIIVTNDGSPDNCIEIVEKLQKEFSNIILINQENKGVSMARNNAIALAKGDYIMPIDPDDYVLPNTLGRILSLIHNKNIDVLYLGYEIFDSKGISQWETNYIKHQNNLYSGTEGYFASRSYEVRDPDRSVAIVYRKELLETFKINYPKDVPFLEDGLFLAKVFTVAKVVGFDNAKFYQRTTRKGSATNSNLYYSDKAINGFLLAARDLNVFGKKNDFSIKQQGLINHVIIKFVLLSIMPLMTLQTLGKFYKTASKLKKTEFSKLDTEGVLDGFYDKLAESYNKSIHLFLFSYFKFRIYKKLNFI